MSGSETVFDPAHASDLLSDLIEKHFESSRSSASNSLSLLSAISEWKSIARDNGYIVTSDLALLWQKSGMRC